MMRTVSRWPLAMVVGISIGVSCACAASEPKPSSDEPEQAAEPAEEAPAVAPAEPAAPPAAAPSQAEDIGSDRPVQVTLTLAGDKSYDGTYHGGGYSRICGNALKAMIGAENGFVFEYPREGDFEITDVAFGAEELAAGRTTTQYRISVGVKAKDGGRPPSFVVRTSDPSTHETGHATRTEAGGTTRLVVDGVNDRGWTLHMTAECGPRAQ